MAHTVLLVDDDPNLLAALQRGLRREPFEVLVADGPDSAFVILAERAVDVIVSDERMPGMPGTEFLGRVRQQYPQAIPMMLTGQGDLEVAMAAINTGEVYRFFTKPCDPRDLAVSIRQALEQKELIQQARLLLHTVRRQAALLAGGPRPSRPSMPVVRDAQGAVILDDVPVDLRSLLREVEAELQQAEARLDSPA